MTGQLALDWTTDTTRTAFERVIRSLPAGAVFTIEDVRDLLDAAGIPADSRRGQLFNAACRTGLIEPATHQIGARVYYLTATSTGESAKGAKVMAYRRRP